MKKLWEKIRALWKKYKKFRRLITFGIFLILGVIILIQRKQNDKLQDKYDTEVNLNVVLNDSVHHYINQQNEMVAERRTIQIHLDQLVKNQDRLNENQKRLLEKISKVEKENAVIAAALIKTNVVLDSIKGAEAVINMDEKEVTFVEATNDYIYDITAKNVLPAYLDVKPYLMFNKFELPNEQFVEFHWKDNRKEGYPTTFSVTNTNQFFKTIDINSYIIPEVKKDVLDPTGWQKFTNWTVKNGKVIITVGVGAAAGAGLTYYLLTR